MRLRSKLRALIALVVVLWPFQFGISGSRVLAQANGWVTLAPLPVAKTAMAVATGTDGRIYVFGGTDNATQDYADAEVYDPTRNAWTLIAPLPAAESYASATLGADGKIYIFGGFNSRTGQSLRNVFAYDPKTDKYACSGTFAGCASNNLAPMPTPRSVMAIALTVDGMIWTIGGFTSTPVATVEVYAPASNTWKAEPPLPSPEAGASATELPFGYIDVWGGYDGSTYNSSDYLLPLPAATPATPPYVVAHKRWARRPATSWSVRGDGRSRPYSDAPLPARVPWWCKYPPARRENELLWVVRHHNFFDLERKIGSEVQMIVSYIYLKDIHFGDPNQRDLEQRLFDQLLNRVCGSTSALMTSTQRAAVVGALHANRALGDTQNSIQVPSLVYAGGAGPTGVRSDVSIYNWWDDTYSAGPPLPGPREAAGSTMDFNGTVYMIGGDDGSTVYNTVLAYTAPSITIDLSTVLSPTTTPLPASTNTSIPATATSTPVPPTVTPVPTATRNPALPLRVTLGHRSVKPGKRQTVTAHTRAGATVRFKVVYPNGARAHRTVTANSAGTAVWTFKQPAGVTRGTNSTARLTVVARSGSETARAVHKSYRIG